MKVAKRKAEFLSTLRYDDLSTFAKPIWLRVFESKPGVGFSLYSKVLGNEIEIPIGFECDGRSSPRLLWGIVPPVGPALWAAVPHDYLYTHGGYHLRVGGTVVFIPIDQAMADRVYRELMILKGFSRAKSWYSYAALRMFGKKAWDEHRARD